MNTVLGSGPLAPVLNAPASVVTNSGNAGGADSFLSLVQGALQGVSATQNQAAVSQAAVAAGLPGASLSQALVASDRAQVAWNAAVAVRNEVVSAYQTVMNMQF